MRAPKPQPVPAPPRYEEAILRDLMLFRFNDVILRVAVKGTKKVDEGFVAAATRLQRLRLVSVTPITSTSAKVELTAAGTVALQQGAER